MITLRIATPGDGKALAAIYEYYVANTTITFEYDVPSAEEFSHRIEHKLEKYPYLVAEEDGKPIGYAYAAEFRERAAYGWDAELSVYVAHGKHRAGVGRRLYSALTQILRAQNFINLYAWITNPNPTSIAFHEKEGFELICNIPTVGYKYGAWHDVVWYQKRVNDMVEPKPIIPFPELDKDTVNKILSSQNP